MAETAPKYTTITSQNHRLEKTSKITKSNHMSTKPYPEVPHLHVF